MRITRRTTRRTRRVARHAAALVALGAGLPACSVREQRAEGRARDLAAGDVAAARAEIATAMARSAAEWNRGDLDAFVSDYLAGGGTTFIGRDGVLHGREEIRAVYAPRFAPGAARDSLSFERLEVDLLAPGVANAIAYYVLSRGDSVVARGPTSLVMRKVGGRWQIAHDHSS